MTVIIGVDPHKATHTAVALDGNELELAEIQVRANASQLKRLLKWATPFEHRTWAVEGAGGCGYLLSQQLVGAGETVLDVPATLAARVRVLGSGRSNKNDSNDARSVAVAALRAPRLAEVRPADHAGVLRLLAKRNSQLSGSRTRTACRLHALLAELVEGGAPRKIKASGADALLGSIEPASPVAATRHAMAREHLDDLRYESTVPLFCGLTSTSFKRRRSRAAVPPTAGLSGGRPRSRGMVVRVQRVDALLEALENQVTIGEHVRSSQLMLDSPCTGWCVRDVLNHSIGVTLKFADFAAGVTDRPRSPRGDLIRGDHRAALRSTADRARAAWPSVDMARTCHLSFGTFSPDLTAAMNLFDVLAHTWDVATAIDVDFDCTDDLWGTGLDAAREVIGGDRDPSNYGLEVPVAPTASPRARFLGYLGRTDSARP